jgi:hypothetical protein
MLKPMLELVVAAVWSFGVVFVAELGDKTQLLELGFGAGRWNHRPVSIVGSRGSEREQPTSASELSCSTGSRRSSDR